MGEDQRRKAKREGELKVMTLGRALHQKPEQSGRDEVGNGEARADAPRDEARPAYQQQEGLGREDLFWQALSRENMAHTQTHMTSTSRTARCGPACRVVWQGRSLTAAPYADLEIGSILSETLDAQSAGLSGAS